MISNNYIPEKVNDYNVYQDGNKMIGLAAEVELPSIKMKTSTIEGVGVGGEIDSPTIGQFESLEAKLKFNTLYSSATDLMNPLNTVNLTLRGASRCTTRPAAMPLRRLRIVMGGRVKEFNPGTVKKGDAMDAETTLELTYYMIEVDGEQVVEVDKLNGVYKVNGSDMLAGIAALT